MKANKDAEKIYFIVQHQYIMGFSGPIEINQMAIHEAMDLYNVADRIGCFEKVLNVSRTMLSEDKEE